MDPRRAEARRALDAVPLNVGFAQAALEVTEAPLWADRDDDPRAFHVVHPCGMSLVWGPAVGSAFADVVAHLAGGSEWLQVEPRWAGLGWDEALGAAPIGAGGAVTRHERVNFAFDPAAHDERRAALAPPAGWRLRRATADDFGLAGSVVPSEYWPEASSFLASGGGMVLEREGAVGAIAFTSFRCGDELELGIETAPEHRRQGLAAAVASAMIDVAADQGLTPVWSCREDNVGSFRLAVALGFVPTTRTPYYHLR